MRSVLSIITILLVTSCGSLLKTQSEVNTLPLKKDLKCTAHGVADTDPEYTYTYTFNLPDDKTQPLKLWIKMHHPDLDKTITINLPAGHSNGDSGRTCFTYGMNTGDELHDNQHHSYISVVSKGCGNLPLAFESIIEGEWGLRHTGDRNMGGFDIKLTDINCD